MLWLYGLLALVVLAACGYGLLYMIVKWALADAPPGTRFMGISNGEPEEKKPAPTQE